MMELKTLEQLSELIYAAGNQMPGNIDTPAVLLPSGMKTESLEHLYKKPARFRGTFNTKHVDHFIEYIVGNSTHQTVIFIDPEALTAKAVFDLVSDDDPHDFGWGEHKAILSLDTSPEYTALKRFNLESQSQRGFIEFIRDWMHCLKFYDDIDGNEFTPTKVVQLAQKIDVNAHKNSTHEEGEFNRKRSSMEMIEINSEEKLPGVMQMNCKPFLELPEQTYNCRLRVMSDGSNVYLAYRIEAFELEFRKTQQTFRDLIQNNADIRETPIYLGNFSNGNNNGR